MLQFRVTLFLYLFSSGMLLFVFSFTFPQKQDYPQHYFQAPVDGTIRLSGTFGELRPNHFHAGIDIKGYIGRPLLATADGFVRRIKVSGGGYGKVLYLDHPNGYTSVYAHMNEFAPEIEAYVKALQYEQEGFEIDIEVEPNRFSFQQGDQIGAMGTTGRSFGPHLHFEIRKTKDDLPINPLLLGIAVEDTRKPRMHELKVYGFNKFADILDANTYNLKDLGRGKYSVQKDTIFVDHARTGLALKVYDHFDGATNWNGVFEIGQLVSDSLTYHFEMEGIPFNESLYINAHLDYKDYVQDKSYFNRCFLLPGNRLSVYDSIVNSGIVYLKKGQHVPVTLFARDVQGNTSNLQFILKRSTKETSIKQEPYTYKLKYDEAHIIATDQLNVQFPEGTFYNDLYLDYYVNEETSEGVYSAAHHIHNGNIPVHKYYTISILPKAIPSHLLDKAFIAYCAKDNEILNCGGQWRGEFLETQVRQLGDFQILVDEEAPKITPVSFTYNLRQRSSISFRITDNFPTTGRAKSLDYFATIDGKWVLMEYDAKKEVLKHRFEDSLEKGVHQFQLVVTDDRNNTAIFKRDFVR